MWVVGVQKGARVGVGGAWASLAHSPVLLLPLSLAVLACPCGVSAPVLLLPVLVVFVSDNIHYV